MRASKWIFKNAQLASLLIELQKYSIENEGVAVLKVGGVANYEKI